MQRRLFALSVFVALLGLHILLLGKADIARKTLPTAAGAGFVVPSFIQKLTSFEFKGVVSDLLFINAMVFKGSTFDRVGQPEMTAEEWRWFDQILNVSTDLDPYFADPYFLANAHMTWDGGMVQETNALLDKGIEHRNWDWVLPFYAGFNNFYFLQDNMRAAEYLMTASRRPGPSEQLVSLASRLAFKERKTENAIVFLQAVAKKTDDQQLKKKYEVRIQALQARLFLEKAVEAYRKSHGRAPASIQQMVERGVVKEIPADPYGGTFSIGPAGAVLCTTDHLLMPKSKER